MNERLAVISIAAALSVNALVARGAEIPNAPTKSATPYVKISARFSGCRIIPGVSADSTVARQDAWGYDLLPKKILDTLEPGADGREFNEDISSTLKIYQQAKHGFVDPVSFNYTPAIGFEGVDTATVSFEYKGKTYLVLHKFIVSIPRGENPLPRNCKDAWRLPNAQRLR